MSARRALAPLFASAYELIGGAAVSIGYALLAAAALVRRDLERERHSHAASTEDREAAHRDLEAAFAAAQRRYPHAFGRWQVN